MEPAGGRPPAFPRRLAWVAATVVAGLAMLGVLGACGAGDDARRVTLSGGASTIAGDVPGVATGSEPPADAPAPGTPAPSAATPLPSVASSSVAASGSSRPVTPAGAGQPPAAGSAVPELGTIHGVVTRSGQRVAGARVTLVAADGAERVTNTDASGSYRFAAVAAGTYEVIVYAESGATCDSGGCISASWAERAEVTLAAGETRQLDIDGD